MLGPEVELIEDGAHFPYPDNATNPRELEQVLLRGSMR